MCVSSQSGSRTEPCGTPKGGKTKGDFYRIRSDEWFPPENHFVDVLDVWRFFRCFYSERNSGSKWYSEYSEWRRQRSIIKEWPPKESLWGQITNNQLVLLRLSNCWTTMGCCLTLCAQSFYVSKMCRCLTSFITTVAQTEKDILRKYKESWIESGLNFGRRTTFNPV